MSEQRLSRDGSSHVTDEKINTITHLIAACFALLGATLVILEAIYSGSIWEIVGFSIYGLSLVYLFVFSALHHGIDGSKTTNEVLRTLDYTGVFFLIAGTVTPIVLVMGRNPKGWALLGTIWALAISGIVLRSIFRQIPKYITNSVFIALGWLPLILLFAVALGPSALLLVLGGVFYSVGFVIYVLEKPNPVKGTFGFHELWHIFVVLGALLQYLFLYITVLPA